MTENLTLTVADHIATIELNRPERMNAFTFDMIDAWAAALHQCRNDDDVRVIVVTGKGDAFCSGGDIVEMQDRLKQEPLRRKNELLDRVQRIPLALEDIDKPVIAAINGAATGAGMDLALMCDLRFATRSARFAETYVKVGLVPGAGGAHFLPRIVGTAKALELFFTGDFIDAEEAHRLGIVNNVFDDKDFRISVDKIVRKIVRNYGPSMRMIKRALYQGMRNDLRTNLDLISSHYGIATALESHREAVKSFVAARSGKSDDKA